jgi:hypothetical protein
MLSIDRSSRTLARRLSYANVMATVAVFVALGGSSYATIAITGKQISNGTVRSADLRNNDLRGRDVRDGSLLAADFTSGSSRPGRRACRATRVLRVRRVRKARKGRQDPPARTAGGTTRDDPSQFRDCTEPLQLG